VAKKQHSPLFSLSAAKKALLQRNILKIQALINDSLTKINALLKKVEGRREILLLTQVIADLLKAQTKLEQLSRSLEKTLPENSSGGNF